MRVFLISLILLFQHDLKAEVKGYIAPKILLGYSVQNSTSNIDSVVAEDNMHAFTYGLGVELIRKSVAAGIRYQNVDYDNLEHDYFLFDLGAHFDTVSNDSMGFGLKVLLGWDQYEWKRIPTTINKYASKYSGESFAYGFGINFYYQPTETILLQATYEAVESTNDSSSIEAALASGSTGEVGFDFNSSFLVSISYGFGVGRYDPGVKEKKSDIPVEDESKKTTPKDPKSGDDK